MTKGKSPKLMSYAPLRISKYTEDIYDQRVTKGTPKVVDLAKRMHLQVQKPGRRREVGGCTSLGE
jgi:hypothetical protein